MKKLMLKLVAFLISLWLLLTIVIYAFPMYMYNLEFALYKNTKNHLEESHDIIIIGDSRAQAGLIPDTIGEDVYSYAVPGGTPIEGYYVLKEYLENNGAPEKIIISFAPYHFERSDTFWERAIKYDFLNFKQGFEIVKTSVRLKDDFTLRGNNEKNLFIKQYGKLFLYKLKSPNYYLSDVSSGVKDAKTNYSTNATVGRMVEQSKGQYYFGRAEFSDKKNSEASRDSFSKSLVLEYYLELLFSLCEEYEVTTYYFAPPMNQVSADALDEDFVSGYRMLLDDMQHKHNGVEIDSSLYAMPNEYFGDESHLNENGAKVFSEDIRKKIGED